MADLNGGGRPDLVVMGESEPYRRNAVVMLQGRHGTFRRASTWPVASSNVRKTDLRVADLDDDGCPDLATGATGDLSVLRGTGDGGLEPAEGAALRSLCAARRGIRAARSGP